LIRLAETQNITTAQLITQLNQEKDAISEELSDLTRRLNRLGETGANEGLIQSVVAAIQGKVAQQRKLEEELKLLRSRAFSMATPRVRADSFASATSVQSAMSEDDDEELRKRAKEALQRARGLGTEVVQRVEPIGLKKLIKLLIQSLRDLAPNAIGTLADLAPQYVEWVRNNPNTAAAAVMLSAVHAIGIQQGFEISGYQLLLDYLKTLGVAPLAADAIRAIMQGGTVVVSALCQEYRRRGEAAIRRAAVAELREIIGRALSAPQYPLLGYNPTERIPPQMPDPYVPPPPPKAAATKIGD
jgi:hypothetical protein